MRLALVFPGQGSQSVGMGHALTHAAAVAVFRTADTALGEPLSALIADGPAERLDQTEHAQPAILATSMAIYRVWSDAAATAGLPAPIAFAGHSMGQYSAMVAAGVLDFPDAIRLARVRGTLMQASPDGAMAAIIGLEDARIPELEAIGSAEGVFTVANRNSPGQIVVSGARAAVQAAADAAKGLGAKRGLVLPVSVAAHSPLMAGAADAMRGELADITFRDPIAPLLANADARPLTTGEACREELIEHLTRGVDWVRAIQALTAHGADTFVEIGPGKVLTNLIRRIAPDVRTLASDDPSAATGLADPGSLLDQPAATE